LQNLFSRKKKGELQNIIVVVDDTAVGEVQFDETQMLKAFRAKLLSSKIANLPKNFGFVNGGNLVRPNVEEATKLADCLAAIEDKIVVQLIAIDDNAGKGLAASTSDASTSSGAATGGPRSLSPGRPALKRTKPKGGAMLDGIAAVSLVEAEAVAIDTAITLLGGIDAITPNALPQIYKICQKLLAEKADSFKDTEEPDPDADADAVAAASSIGQLYSVAAINEAVKGAIAAAKPSLPTGASANVGKYHAGSRRTRR
jgi:hypothetical protein